VSQAGALAGPGARAGTRRVGICRARRGGALVRGARRGRGDTGGDSMTPGGSASRSGAAVAAMGLVALAAWWGGGRTDAGTPPPRFGHVFILVEENHGYADVIGHPAMPFSHRLAT